MPTASTTLYVDPRVWCVTTVANLRLQDGPGITGALANILTGGVYMYNADDETADNGTTVIKPAGIAADEPGRWNRIAS